MADECQVIQPFTDKECIVRLLGLRGVIAFSDHEECGEEDDAVIEDVICRATEEIAGVLFPLYEIEGLSCSKLVKQWATVLASFYLAERRGNPIPESLYADYERIFARPEGLIERARTGSFTLRCAKRSDATAPTWSNLSVDRRFITEKIRVVQTTSSPIDSAVEQDQSPIIGRR